MVLFNLLPLFTAINVNEFVILIAIIFFISFIIVYLRKMDTENDGLSVRINRPQLSAQSMVKIKNPFMFKLSEESLNCDNYIEGIKLCITCDNSFWVISYWAVNIDEIHYNLDIDWRSMRHQLLDGLFMSNSYLFRGEPELYHECNEEVTHLVRPPSYFNGESLGDNPRTRYPLVVIIVRNDDDDGLELNDNDVVCLISIIHLKDSICRMSTGLITQYLKQRGGSIFNLQQIYASETAFDTQSTRLCVICQTTSISHAILPCRHACLCGPCFERIDKCPLCRSSITSFFKINEGEDHGYGDEDEFHNNQNQTMSQSNSGWFSSLNAKLNQWLGMS